MASVCAHCGRDLDSTAVVFHEYKFETWGSYSLIGDQWWEEDTGEGRRYTLSDKINSKTLCALCAAKFRVEMERQNTKQLIVKLVLMVISILIMIALIAGGN